ncbi:MAG: hypothetical protein OXG36_13555 [Caldilineaceae bacterium]|nr:hypothetical protein [Caldilineaceae bacterium]
MFPDDLLNMAEGLATGAVSHRRGRPRRSDLSRAVSSIYYALFHTLAAYGSDLLVGRTKDLRSEPAWRQAYRALEHGKARNQCRRKEYIAKFPGAVEDFATLFVHMQRLRHLADYDPDTSFSRSEVLQWLDDSRDALHDLSRVPHKDLRAFAVYLLLPMRERVAVPSPALRSRSGLT